MKPKGTVQLDRKEVEELFHSCGHQLDIIEKLFKMVYPNFEEIERVLGYVVCNNKTWKHICKWFMSFDRKHHESFPGGAWLNYGFSVHDSCAEDLDDFEVFPAPVLLKLEH